MEDMADAIIGDPESGLAVEQRKRVTIGVELAAKPELLLFLDEPTSGLDSQSAFNIVRFLKKLAGAGQAILCTIHQPNAALFENFDRLLLLQRGGQTVYFGDIGKDACVLIDYLRRHGADCPPDANPAEYMLASSFLFSPPLPRLSLDGVIVMLILPQRLQDGTSRSQPFSLPLAALIF
jgi:ABC-type multidrug transport system ATPase subunit